MRVPAAGGDANLAGNVPSLIKNGGGERERKKAGRSVVVVVVEVLARVRFAPLNGKRERNARSAHTFINFACPAAPLAAISLTTCRRGEGREKKEKEREMRARRSCVVYISGTKSREENGDQKGGKKKRAREHNERNPRYAHPVRAKTYRAGNTQKGRPVIIKARGRRTRSILQPRRFHLLISPSKCSSSSEYRRVCRSACFHPSEKTSKRFAHPRRTPALSSTA